MYYLIYKITNIKNKKIYIGSHKTANIDDNYMGSGKLITQAIKKYGLDSFTKEILFVYDTVNEMYQKEAELVNEEFIKNENTYNLKIGGTGGFDYINSNRLNNKSNQASIAGKTSAAKGAGFKGKQHSVEVKQHLSTVLLGRPATFKGKQHSQYTKDLISAKTKGKQAGANNSQYGTMWMTNGVDNIKICKDKFELYTAMGYFKGRKI